MSDNIIRLSTPKTAIAPVWITIWEGAMGEDGDRIILAHETWPPTDSEAYVILYASPSDELEIVQRFPYVPEFEALAKFAAGIADKTLSTIIFMQPYPGGDFDVAS